MKEILVYADWSGLAQQAKMGILRVEQIRGEEIFSFEYNKQWLLNNNIRNLDPDLKFFGGAQYLNNEKVNFGMFLDSAPDRWGKMLMKRREAIRARKLGEQPKSLMESDFLLGVNDATRMGGLRFKLDESGDFLESNEEVKTPPITSIRELEQASLHLENDAFFEKNEASKWLNMILAPGSSLGGARPKANVINTDGSLWIAKFPSKNDEKNSGAWEYIVNQLAKKLDITVATAVTSRYSQNHHTYLTKRFDRTKTNERIHFASAMTLLGYKDGYSYQEGASYLELVDLIEQYGSQADKDIKELWRRIVFSVAVSNTDDHLRNHGFLLSKDGGWHLSPAYDINPNEDGVGLSLNISEEENSLDYDLCLSVAEYFRWKINDAKEFISLTKKEVVNWATVASEIGIARSEKNQMERAFKIN